MGTILLGVDAKHYAPEATELARELGQATASKIIIVHVHEIAVGRFGRLLVDCAEGEAEQLVTDIKASLTHRGADAEAEIRETHVGRVAKAILEAADEHDARFIVLGSSHSTDLPLLPVGSTALRVLHHSHRPVMVVPRGAVAKAAALAAAHQAASAVPAAS
ncbi:MAG: universal stress protein [Nocardiopsaceae bacterium]|jgi:nucleotide-binding universal stress UspA family protein|nr:universal stress protein [Nocardiopsaceae bacterium]